MSKLSFRARALDASKPMPIYMAEELPDLPDYSAINRAVPQMPSGMEKEEECEHHLQRAICTGLIIPTPEVTDLADVEAYDKIYPADYKLPRQLIHMQPFAMEQDIPDYDMDSEDEKWVDTQSRKLELTPLLFEEMMDRLEKNSGQNAVTLNEAKALLKEDDDLIIAVFDYWLNKRLKTQHPLVLSVKTENRSGSSANNPYIAFRRRTEKMQTRKNRKNDETSYEKMLKLRRDLSRAVTLLEMVKRREKTKREHLHLTIEIYEKRYQAQDFNGQVLAEVSALRAPRPAFAPLFTNQFGVHQNWTNKVCKDEIVPRKEKRQYKKRKHKTDSRGGSLDDTGVRSGTGSGGGRGNRPGVLGSGLDPLISSDDDSSLPSHSHSQPLLPSDRDDEDAADEGQFAFRRNRSSTYLPPVSGGFGNWPWCDKDEGGLADKKYRFALTSISKPVPRCIGLARRRMGRGGRMILDRCTADMDEMWSSLDYTIHDSGREPADSTVTATATTIVKQEWPHFRPKTPPESTRKRSRSPSEESNYDTDSDVESAVSRSKLPYPFPPEATSICIEVEPERASDEVPFTSEFNIADYFTPDAMSDFEVAVAGLSSTGSAYVSGDPSDSGVNISRTDDGLGSSHFVVTPLMNNLFAPPPTPARPPQCSGGSSGGSSVVHTSTSSSSIPQSSSVVACTTNQAVASSTVSTQCAVGIGAAVDAQLNHQPKQQQQHRQLPNNSIVASILSKSLTSPTNNRNGGSCSGNGGSGSGGANIRVFSASAVSSGGGSGGSGGGITNFSNSHQNGPLPHINNSNNLTNSTHVVNNQQSTLVLPQKHPPSNLLPGLIAQSKLASLARQQQQQTQNQAQQVPTSGEITLNSNSESLDMEVDEVDSSPCDSKPQQQQLVRANKTNSLAMEVT
ncbi:enhancer of polycomb homolog 1 [Linepithema humile]|uniref:enhancer of polycomb homolog 1 n=1 Tax=Linepithema humile TaxID=83485 RepID=UPI0006232C9F|nr:PREDICTED: enhancer of polycomb homolog 1 [Linepithema humile]XP_012220867.1 PREDICTED: enhancer of polycomb homolog 1 [Linepithema humile]